MTLVAPTPKKLLAKSYDGYPGPAPRYARLTEHSRDVAAACRVLVASVGRTLWNAAGMDSHRLPHFERTLVLNGWLQDLGKANSHFHQLVTTEGNIQQLLRHETLSAGIVWCHPPLREWFAQVEDEVLLPALWGAIGHHRKFDDATGPNGGEALTVFASHEDFHTILADLAEDLQFTPPPRLPRDLTVGYERDDFGATRLVRRMQEDFEDREAQFGSLDDRKFIALVKALGIVADVTASAVAKRTTGRDAVAGFIKAQLTHGLAEGDLEELICKWAWSNCGPAGIEPVEGTRPPGFEERPFQIAVAESESFLTVAEAGCGSGKSLAAYMWAKRWARDLHSRDAREFRLFFCLPTTGTATEHFKDYALECGVPSDLAHSRSEVDLRLMSETAAQEESDDNRSSDPAGEALRARRDKIDALALWSTPLVVATADTVLGLMANARRSLCTLPAIAQSAIVFDEVHAFDDHLFGHLLQFLRLFPKLPVLLMTASLSMSRRDALREVRSDLHIVPGPEHLETIERYELLRNDEAAAWERVRSALSRGERVLWVRNRVDWANATWEAARANCQHAERYLYHSRFRYKDRSWRHRRVIDAFKRGAPNGVLLVATQVAEMSLDLSADLLVTDIAPVPSLIQRLGRLNRRAKKGSPPRPVLVLPLPPYPGNMVAPYEKDDVVTAGRWLDELAGKRRPFSQRDLATGFAALAPGAAFDLHRAERTSSFLGFSGETGLWRTRPGVTRADGYTITVVLEVDAERSRSVHGAKGPSSAWLREHEVSIPLKPGVATWDQLAGVPIAPRTAVTYDFNDTTGEGMGARWLAK